MKLRELIRQGHFAAVRGKSRQNVPLIYSVYVQTGKYAKIISFYDLEDLFNSEYCLYDIYSVDYHEYEQYDEFTIFIHLEKE